MARNRKNKKLWKCRKKGTSIIDTLASAKAATAATPAVSAAPIPSHLSESDQAQRRSCERRLVDIIETRLIREGPEMELNDLAKIQKMLCELKKQDIAAENHQLARAKAQAELDDRAAEAERNRPRNSDISLRDVIASVYGLEALSLPQPWTPKQSPTSTPDQTLNEGDPTTTQPPKPVVARSVSEPPIPNNSQTNRLLPAESVVS